MSEEEHLCSYLSMIVDYRDPLGYFFPIGSDLDLRNSRVKCEKLSNKERDPYILTLTIRGIEPIELYISRNSIEGIYFVSGKKNRLALYHAGDCVRLIDPDYTRFYISMM